MASASGSSPGSPWTAASRHEAASTSESLLPSGLDSPNDNSVRKRSFAATNLRRSLHAGLCSDHFLPTYTTGNDASEQDLPKYQSEDGSSQHCKHDSLLSRFTRESAAAENPPSQEYGMKTNSSALAFLLRHLTKHADKDPEKALAATKR